MAIVKTRKQWAEKIRAVHKRFVDGFFKIGRELIAAKKVLPHGQFLGIPPLRAALFDGRERCRS